MVLHMRKKGFQHFRINNKKKPEHTVPETPEQIDVTEQYIWTAVETARIHPISSKLPMSRRLRAFDTAAYVRKLVNKINIEKKNLQKNQRSKTEIRTVEGFWMPGLQWTSKMLKIKIWSESSQACFPRVKHVFLGYDNNRTAELL